MTNFARYNPVISSINNTNEALALSSRRLATGKALHTASEDPLKFAQAERTKVAISEKGIAVSMLSFASDKYAAAEVQLNGMTEVMGRIKELTVVVGNPLNPREGVVAEVQALKEQVRNALNAKDTQGYIFSGDPSTEPFPVATPGYQGGAGRTLELASTNIQTSLNGGPLADVLKGLEDFEAALATPGPIAPAVNAALETAMDTLVSFRADLGARASSVDSQKQLAEMDSDRLELLRGRLEDTDMVAETIKLRQSEAQQEMNYKVLGMHFNAKRLMDFI